MGKTAEQLESERLEAWSRFEAAKARAEAGPTQYIRNADWLRYDWLPDGKTLADIRRWRVTVQTTSEVMDGCGALVADYVGTVASVDKWMRDTADSDLPVLIPDRDANVLMILAVCLLPRRLRS